VLQIDGAVNASVQEGSFEVSLLKCFCGAEWQDGRLAPCVCGELASRFMAHELTAGSHILLWLGAENDREPDIMLGLRDPGFLAVLDKVKIFLGVFALI
jgi:hypothetical protein